MNSDTFLIFSLGFFLFAVLIVLIEGRRSEDRRDRRADIEYNRMLNERREFGYKNVEESIQRSKPSRIKFRK